MQEEKKQITKEWLLENRACREGSEWFFAQKETDSIKVVRKLLKENHFNWANWLIVRLMDKPQKVAYAIFAARQVLEIFEKKYPEDKRPRKAIEAAEDYLKNPTEENRAAYAAYAAAAAAAAYAAYAAYAAAAAAAAAAAYAADAADAAAAAAAAAAADARKEIQKRIVENGIKILKSK